MPDQFLLQEKGQTALHLHVGEGLVSELERPFQKPQTTRFDLIGTRGKKDLRAARRAGDKPFGRVPVGGAGTYLVAVERRPQLIKLGADKFTRYLADEGLAGIIEQRQRLGESKLPGRERYSRYLKCLLQAGGRLDDTYKRVLGQRLEIVPEANPFGLRRLDRLPVRILFEGKPLAGVKVSALHRAAAKTHTLTAVTDGEGRATFRLDRPGPWLVRLVHMRRCTDRKEADWESFWGALTFALKQ
jgi:hypothetical protein